MTRAAQLSFKTRQEALLRGGIILFVLVSMVTGLVRAEVDLDVSNSPADDKVLSYNSGSLQWNNTLWTKSGSDLYNSNSVAIGTDTINAASVLTLGGPMIGVDHGTPAYYMYGSGVTNAEKPLFVHSAPYPDYGLYYQDVNDYFVIKGAGTTIFRVYTLSPYLTEVRGYLQPGGIRGSPEAPALRMTGMIPI